MSGTMRRWLAVPVATALLLSIGQTGGATAAEGAPAGGLTITASGAEIVPPSGIDVRFGSLAGASPVALLARIHPSASTTRERVVVQVAVRPHAGGARILGPERSVAVGDQSPALSVSEDGTVRGLLPLTAAQRSELVAWQADLGDSRAARQVSVLLRHEADTDPARPGFDDLGSAGDSARLGGEALSVPRELRDSPGTVSLANNTPNPLVLLVGPAQCMYDTVYAWGTESADGGGSYLGSANGTLLLPGQRISIKVDKDAQTLDGKESNGSGTEVIADYQLAVSSAYRLAQAEGDTELPEIALPEGESSGTWDELIKESSLFVVGVVNWVAEGAGVTEALLAALGAAEIAETFSFVLDVALQFIEIAGVIAELFDNGCGGAPGYILIGATDVAQPWRSTSQTYSWNGANPVPAQVKNSSGDKVNATPSFNGMVMNTFTPILTPPVQSAWLPALNDPGSNNDVGLWNPVNKGTTFSWNFTEPSTAVAGKSTISVAGRVVTCGNPDADRFTQAVAATGIPAVGMWLSQNSYAYYSMASGAAVRPNVNLWPQDYFVGEGYVFAGHSSMAVYATSGVPDSSGSITWSTVLVPPGASQVAIPSTTKAAWVKCGVQIPEMMAGDLPTDRTLLLGTNVPSDTVPGPDYPR